MTTHGGGSQTSPDSFPDILPSEALTSAMTRHKYKPQQRSKVNFAQEEATKAQRSRGIDLLFL